MEVELTLLVVVVDDREDVAGAGVLCERFVIRGLDSGRLCEHLPARRCRTR